MARRLQYVTVECATCNHRSKVDGVDLESRIDADLTFDTVGRISKRFVCRSCHGRSINVYDDSMRLLIDSSNIACCRICGGPILISRLDAIPETTLCAGCAVEASVPPRQIPYPHPPAGKTKCPRCGQPTIIRQNSESSDHFLACTGFPKCKWTSPVDIRPGMT